jgi:hypothetical protein
VADIKACDSGDHVAQPGGADPDPHAQWLLAARVGHGEKEHGAWDGGFKGDEECACCGLGGEVV